MTRSGAARLASAVLVAVAAVVTVALPGSAAVPSSTVPSSAYVPVGPIRLADTRAGSGFERLDPQTIRIPVHGRPGVPDATTAAVLTLTVTGTRGPLVATVWPAGLDRPLASTSNATGVGQTIANGAVVALGDGAVEVYLSSPADVVVDLSGVFVPAESASSGRFTPVAPQRLLDTREMGTGSPVSVGGTVTIPLPASVAPDATAVAVNVTITGPTVPGYVTLHPAGVSAPWASHLNTDRPGQTRAAAAIVPVSAAGLAVTAATGGHVVVDLAGWFTGPSATAGRDGLFVPSIPRRLVDTRSWPAGVPVWPQGTIEIAESAGGTAAALLVNATATEPMAPGYLTLHPAGTPRPLVSNLNVDPAAGASTVANMAVVQASDRGLAAFSSGGTQLVVDLAGVFLGAPVPAPLDPAPNVSPPSPATVSIVGDSLVAALPAAYVSSLAGRGVEATVDAQSSRALRWGWQCRVNGSLRIVATPAGTGCRREGLEQLSYWRSTGALRSAVVVALGNNDAVLYGPARVATNFDTVRALVGDRPLYLVSVRALGALDGSMQRFNDAARSWCATDRSCRVIEWASHPVALARSSYLSDGEHLTLAATRVRAEVIAAAVAP